MIKLDVRRRGGQPVIEGRNVRASTIAELVAAGEARNATQWDFMMSFARHWPLVEALVSREGPAWLWNFEVPDPVSFGTSQGRRRGYRWDGEDGLVTAD